MIKQTIGILALLGGFLHAEAGPPAVSQVHLSARIVVFDEEMIGKLGLANSDVLGKVTEAQFKVLQRNWATRGKEFQDVPASAAAGKALDLGRERAAGVAAITELPPAIVESGTRTKIAMEREIRVASEFSEEGEGKAQAWKAIAWQMEDNGMLLDVGPTIIPDARNIDLHIKLRLSASYVDREKDSPDRKELGGSISMPIGNVFVHEGETLLIGGEGPVANFLMGTAGDAKFQILGTQRPFIICLTARIMGPAAMELNPLEAPPLETRAFTAPAQMFDTVIGPGNQRNLLTAILMEHGLIFPAGTKADVVPAAADTLVMEVHHTRSSLDAIDRLIQVRKAADEVPRPIQVTATLCEASGTDEAIIEKWFHKTPAKPFRNAHESRYQTPQGLCRLYVQEGKLSDGQTQSVLKRLAQVPGARLHATQTLVIGGTVTCGECVLIEDLQPNDPRYANRLHAWKLGEAFKIHPPTIIFTPTVSGDGHGIDVSIKGPQWHQGRELDFRESLQDGESILIGGYEGEGESHHCLLLVKVEFLGGGKAAQ